MLYTYLNDNQHMAYPFFGDQALPFPNSCIIGLGLCLQGDAQPQKDVNMLFASTVVITANSVWLSVCRDVSTGTTQVAELVGLFYANTDGYYIFVPSYLLDAVYENQTILPEQLRFVFSVYAEDGMTEEEADALANQMQVFYSYVKDGTALTNTKNNGCGYLLLGTIPNNAIGTYTGRFYFDPSCITYMPDAVLGYHQEIRVNNMSRQAAQAITLNTGGILDTAIQGSDVDLIRTSSEGLVTLPTDYKEKVTGLNGYNVTATDATPYPSITFINDMAGALFSIDDSVAGTVVLNVHGGTAFPNCYKGDDDADSF